MSRSIIAYGAPFVTFLLLLMVSGSLDTARMTPGSLQAKYLVYPLQTVICAGVLAWFWRWYQMRMPRRPWVAALAGVLMFGVWIAPQALLHQAPRLDGFDPGVLAGRPGLYWGQLVFRFLRLVVVVPLLEEIFWRGLLLRVIIDKDFESVFFGTYGRMANVAVAIGFMLEHNRPDWPAALICGFAYNLVAYRTRSLSSCVLAHAITNALLGTYIMATRQWGFW